LSLAQRSDISGSMRYSAVVVAAVLLAPTSSFAADVSTLFSFRMITDSGVQYSFDESQLKRIPIVLPAGFVLESWRCEREPVVLNNSGSGYV
jgi:hypothetical protein